MTTTDTEIVETPHLTVQWTRIRGRLQAEVGEVEYRTWLRQMTLAGLDGDEVTVTLPTRFLRDWVSTRYGDRLRAMWQSENSSIRRVDIRVGTAIQQPAALAESVSAPRDAMSQATTLNEMTPREINSEGVTSRGTIFREQNLKDAAVDAGKSAAREPVAPTRLASVSTAGGWQDDRAESRSDLAAPLDPRFTFEGFVVGKPNEFAYACARRVAERPVQPRLQPAVPLWRRWSRQDPSHARDRLGTHRPRGQPGLGRVHVGRKVHVPVHCGYPQPVNDGIQGEPAQRRRSHD